MSWTPRDTASYDQVLASSDRKLDLIAEALAEAVAVKGEGPGGADVARMLMRRPAGELAMMIVAAVRDRRV